MTLLISCLLFIFSGFSGIFLLMSSSWNIIGLIGLILSLTIFGYFLLNSSIGNLIQVPKLVISAFSFFVPLWTPITLKVDKRSIGEPDDPGSVLHEWNILVFKILSILPIAWDAATPSGYCNKYIGVSFVYILV